MNLRKLADHTIDIDRLPDAPVVLDVGARGFGFTREVLALRPAAKVIALEPDPTIGQPGYPGLCVLLHTALVHEPYPYVRYVSFSTGEGNFVGDAIVPFSSACMVPAITITQLMDRLRIKHWDVVKLDCEGSEFGILANWPGPIADQISVEFHDGIMPDRASEVPKILEHLAQWYDVVQHERTPIGPGPTWGYWDSLLVLNR